MKKIFFLSLLLLLFLFPISAKADIVDTVNMYTYSEMVQDLAELQEAYPQFVSINIIGLSVCNQPIYSIRLGDEYASQKVMIQASIHGREYQSTQVIMRMIEYYADSYSKGQLLDIYNNTCFYIIPMSNPDGVTIAQLGADWFFNTDIKAFVQSQGNYSMWKANALGVDLNRNFNAAWEETDSKGKTGPAYEMWKGNFPESEPESKILTSFAQSQNFDAYINLHQRGNVIYYGSNLYHTDSIKLAKAIKAVNGYSIVAINNSSYGTFADWICFVRQRPSVTLEIGDAYGLNGQSKVTNYYEINKNILIAINNYLLAN